jgi:2-desacetyl-2-hydroxyethyl bacteriochlorophyllide A dehydrogenase
MKVATLVAPRQLVLSERRAPEPGPGEVRIAVHVVGICGTDMEFYSGRRTNGYPFVLGHECAGIVDAVGPDVTAWRVGDRVTVRPNFGCGRCERCREGRDNICPHSRGLGVTIDGCLAEFISAPSQYVFPIPQGLSLEQGALIEPLAVADRAVRRAETQAGDRILVLGAGTIGLFAVRCAALAGADVAVCDPILGRLEIARDLGASRAVPDLEELGQSRHAGFDAVIETAGVAQTVPLAVQAARPGGRVVLTGIPMQAVQVETRWIVWRELEIHGSFIYEVADFARAARRIEDGSVRALDLVTDRFSIDEVAEAFERVAGRGGLKTLIKIAQEED